MRKIIWAWVVIMTQIATSGFAQIPTLDLDANNSSGATGSSFIADNCRGSRSSMVDNDIQISSASAISSATVTLNGASILNGTNERLIIANLALSDVFRSSGTPRITVSGSGTQSITITNNSNATVNDFRNALQLVKYFNAASSPTLGNRTFTVTVTNAAGSASASATLKLVVCDDQCSLSSILNNSFEQPTVSGSWQQFNVGSVPGWQHYQGTNAPNAGGGLVEIQTLSLGFASSCPDGTRQYAEIDREVNLEQSFSTIPGQKYIIRFALSHRPNVPSINGSGNRVISIEFNGVVLDKIETAYSTALASWQYRTYYVTPSTTLSKLAFFADFNSTLGVLVDDFSIYAAGVFPNLVVNNIMTTNLTLPALTAGSDSGSGYVLSYHNTQDDAIRNVNPVANPTQGVPGRTYYLRLSNLACFSVKSYTVPIALPVELRYFTAEATPNKPEVQLRWASTTEQNNMYYVLERSSDGKDWQFMTKVKAVGTSAQPHTYSLVDNNPATGINYYRLSHLDISGTGRHLGIAQARVRQEVFTVMAQPNPVRDILKISLSDVSQNCEIYLWNALQQAVFTHTQISVSEVNISVNHLPTGIYYLEVRNAQQREIQKILVQ